MAGQKNNAKAERYIPFAAGEKRNPPAYPKKKSFPRKSGKDEDCRFYFRENKPADDNSIAAPIAATIILLNDVCAIGISIVPRQFARLCYYGAERQLTR